MSPNGWRCCWTAWPRCNPGCVIRGAASCRPATGSLWKAAFERLVEEARLTAEASRGLRQGAAVCHERSNSTTRSFIAGKADNRCAGIARDLAVSRWRVSRTIRRHQAARGRGVPVDASNSALPAARGRRGSKLDAFESAIAPTARALSAHHGHADLRGTAAAGYTGGYTILRERVKQLREPAEQAAGGALRDGAGRSGPNGLGRLRDRLHRRKAGGG